MESEIPANVSGFGQSDPTDNRALLDWKTKYTDPVATKEIRWQAAYLALLLVACPIGLAILWLRLPEAWLSIPPSKYSVVLKYGLSWISGTLGGVLFGIKWLYHVVARQLWHQDRTLWRIFTPHISGGLAFGVTALIGSGVVQIFNAATVNRSVTIVGIGFLVGYFSDSSIAKLTEIAETLFGTNRSREKHHDLPSRGGEGLKNP